MSHLHAHADTHVYLFGLRLKKVFLILSSRAGEPVICAISMITGARAHTHTHTLLPSAIRNVLKPTQKCIELLLARPVWAGKEIYLNFFVELEG